MYANIVMEQRDTENYSKKQAFALTNRGIVPILYTAGKPGFLKETCQQRRKEKKYQEKNAYLLYAKAFV